jgi:hypothetical protein
VAAGLVEVGGGPLSASVRHGTCAVETCPGSQTAIGFPSAGAGSAATLRHGRVRVGFTPDGQAEKSAKSTFVAGVGSHRLAGVGPWPGAHRGAVARLTGVAATATAAHAKADNAAANPTRFRVTATTLLPPAADGSCEPGRVPA